MRFEVAVSVNRKRDGIQPTSNSLSATLWIVILGQHSPLHAAVMAQTQFANPRSDLVTHASPSEAISPWPIYLVLILGAIALSVMWYIGRAPIHVTQPTLTVESKAVILTSKATNHTNKPVRLILSFLL